MTSTNIYPQELQALISKTIDENKDVHFVPTYLYIKQHSITGLLYFGKTTKDHEDMLKYTGSGCYWLDHLNIHGKEHVETLWYCLFTDLDSVIEFALSYSFIWNIVKEKDINNKKLWANQILEDGVGTQPGYNHTSEALSKISKSSKYNRNRPEVKLNHSKMMKNYWANLSDDELSLRSSYAKESNPMKVPETVLKFSNSIKLAQQSGKHIKLHEFRSSKLKSQNPVDIKVSCIHCKKTTSINWFSRKHTNCHLSISTSIFV